ncbi:MAG TPA: sensor domain-containing diguanylate cyclase [Mycobacteriales bacterium]|nr:sensor domain-containing diguanylate cyclase [Mycobacteriales bacterium]
MRGENSRSPALAPDRVAAAERALSAVADAEPGLVRLARLAREVLGASICMVTLLDGTHEELRAVVGLPEPYRSGARVPLEVSICVRLVETGVPLVIPDLAADPALRHHPAVSALGLRRYAGVPLRLDGHVVGALCVVDEAGEAWSERDLGRLEDVAVAVQTDLGLRAAVAELSVARERERRLAAEQAALSRIATAVAAGQSPAQVLEAVADEVAALLGGSASVVRLAPDAGPLVVARAGPDEPGAEAVVVAVAAVRRTGRPAMAMDGATPCLAAPVVAGGVLWGALVATGAAAEGGGTAELARLAHLLGLGIAIAEAQERLLVLSRSDPLTGAANRRVLDERLAAELDRARRRGGDTALAVLDVDHFQALTDEHGHERGDRVLRELVQRLRAQLRGQDLLVRTGGDEFVVLLPETGYAAAAVVLERLHQVVEAGPVAGLVVSLSMGGAVASGGVVRPDELFRAAGRALYEGKEAGRNGVLLVQLR